LQVDTVDQAGIEYRTDAEARTDLGLVIGTNVQAWDAGLDTLALDDFSNAAGLDADGGVSALHIGEAELAAGAVTNGKIGNDAVSLAKMLAGTAGNLISYDAAGDPVAVATGTSSQVLKSNGVGLPPTFQDATGGGTVTSSGPPLLNEVAVFTTATDIGSDPEFTWNGTTLSVQGQVINVNGINIAAADTYKISNDPVLTATSLGTNVVGSSLTSVGTLEALTEITSIEMGGALTDTTITRTGAGAIAVEGTAVLLSGDTLSATNMTTGSLALGTGTISGGVVIETTGATPYTMGAATGQWIMADEAGAAQIDMPALASGSSFCVYSTTAQVISLNPSGGEHIFLAGATIGAGDELDSPGALGDFVCLLSNGTNWYVLGLSGVWVDGGPT